MAVSNLTKPTRGGNEWNLAAQAAAMLLYKELDSTVQIVSFSEARERFKAILDRVEADADVTLITRRHAQGAAW
jgi:hypothetical protein